MLGHGFAVGLTRLVGFKFNPSVPYTYCCICGDIFQNSDILARRDWSKKHAKTHPEREHLSLKLSGRHLTPEAAHRLAAFGIISITDLVLDDEVSDAYRLSSPIPVNDAEPY